MPSKQPDRSSIDDMLIKSLVEVRRQFDAREDTWREAALQTFQKYLEAIGIDPALRAPIMKFRNEQANDRFLAARRREEKTGTPMPANKSHLLTTGAAAVTVLHERGKHDIGEAVKAVSRAAGINGNKLRNFRDNINRATASDDVLKTYPEYLAAFREWQTEDILESLARIRGFVD